MFNRKERVALLFLFSALVVGSAAAIVDYRDPDRLEDFAVIHGAVPVPMADATDTTSTAGAALHGDIEADDDVKVAPVAVNSADSRELERLPSVGPKTAARIVQYRDQHGPFATVEALQQVAGIGPRTLERLRPFVVLQ